MLNKYVQFVKENSIYIKILKYSHWLCILDISLNNGYYKKTLHTKVFNSENLEIAHMYNKKVFSKWREMEYYVIIKIMLRGFFKHGKM